MPKTMHDALKKRATELKLTGRKRNAFIYSGMMQAGYRPKKKRSSGSRPGGSRGY
jgi:hypothetical protein